MTFLKSSRAARETKTSFGWKLALALALGLATNLAQSETGRTWAFASRDAEGHSLHGKIVADALSSTLNAANLDLVIRCLEEQARDKNEGESKLFAGPSLKSAVNFIDREQKKVLNYAGDADVSPAGRYRCLKHFGALLFAAQDFYSRSNYVELQAERMTEKFGKGGFDPYNIELADWNTLNNAFKQNGSIVYTSASQPKETAEQGKASLAASTYYKVARELAVRETSRQWELLETLIKHRYHERAITILAALKQASCPASEPDLLDN